MIPLTIEPQPPEPPAGWRWELLTDLARLESGHTPSRRHPEWWGGDIPWLALPDIRAVDCRVIDATAETINASGIANSSARILPAETVALSRTASVGFVTVLGRPMATSQDFVCWVCGPQLQPRFLMHLLHVSRDYIRGLASGAIHKTVYVPTVRAFRVCVPAVPEQNRIATLLDGQLSAAARSLAAADAQADALGSAMTASLEQLLRSIAPDGCVTRRCGEVARVSGGIQKSPGRSPRSFHRPFLTVRNVQRGYLDLADIERMEVTPAELERCRLKDGDLLVVEGNGSREQIGRNALFRGEIDECLHQNHVIRVRAQRDVLNPEFLSVFLNSHRGMAQMLGRAMTTTGLHTLSVRKVQSLEIPVPPLPEQNAVVARWASRRRAFETASQALSLKSAAAADLPAALLRRAFSTRPGREQPEPISRGRASGTPLPGVRHGSE